MKTVFLIIGAIILLALIPVASYAFGGSTLVTAVLALCAVVLPACLVVYKTIESNLMRDEHYQLLSGKLEERFARCAPQLELAYSLLEKIGPQSLARAFVPGNGSDKILVRAQHLIPIFIERFREIEEHRAKGTLKGLTEAERLLESSLPVPRDAVHNLLGAEQIGSLHPTQWEPILSSIADDLKSIEFVQDQRQAG